jgi:hypothetical protein
MKSLTTLPIFIAVLFTGSLSFSQSYTAEYSSLTYQPLVGANLLDESNPTLDGVGSEVYKAIPIGFSYEFSGTVYDSLRIAESGYVSFSIGTTEESYISIFDCFLKDFNDMPTESPIYYETSGATGNQTFKCEFVKKGFENDTDNDDHITFQLWLYESCNEFEIRIGGQSIDLAESDLYFNNSTCAAMGYGQYSPMSYSKLSGSPAAPTLVSGNPFAALETEPDSSSVYTFTNCSLGIDKEQKEIFEVYPNPANNDITINLKDFEDVKTINLINSQGQLVLTKQVLNNTSIMLNVSELDHGIYTVQVVSEKTSMSQKIIIQ